MTISAQVPSVFPHHVTIIAKSNNNSEQRTTCVQFSTKLNHSKKSSSRPSLVRTRSFLRNTLMDNMVFVAGGQASKPNRQIVEAHRPGKGEKFTSVEMTEMTIIDQGAAAVVTCQGTYEGPGGTHVLKF